MAYARFSFRVHAIQRMFERAISEQDVRQVVVSGEMIEEYPEDKPYPSRLMLGWSGPRPLHVVVADHAVAEESVIITVYEPDPTEWEPGFKRRKLR